MIIIIVAAIIVALVGAAVIYFWLWSCNLGTEEIELAVFTAVEVGKARWYSLSSLC